MVLFNSWVCIGIVIAAALLILIKSKTTGND